MDHNGNVTIGYWKAGARKALHSAELLRDGGEYASALFHCHLAVEKALKAKYMEEYKKRAPHVHNLEHIASQLKRDLVEEEKLLLRTMNRFVTEARYSDPPAAEEYATKENADKWIEHVRTFLSLYDA